MSFSQNLRQKNVLTFKSNLKWFISWLLFEFVHWKELNKNEIGMKFPLKSTHEIEIDFSISSTMKFNSTWFPSSSIYNSRLTLTTHNQLSNNNKLFHSWTFPESDKEKQNSSTWNPWKNFTTFALRKFSFAQINQNIEINIHWFIIIQIFQINQEYVLLMVTSLPWKTLEFNCETIRKVSPWILFSHWNFKSSSLW